MTSSTLQETIKGEPLWQDRDVRFDCNNKDLALRKGENVIQNFLRIEDTKGNSGDLGSLAISNLRIIWQSNSKPRINLSVGLGCIISIANRTLHSKLRGKYDAIHIMSKVSGTRYEFIFTQFSDDGSTSIDSSRSEGSALPQLLGKVCKAYTSTKLFRDLKLRSAIMSPQGRQLKTLPGEQIYSKINGVWNLSSDQGNLGTMYVTTIRIVWHANMNELFNLSLPYLQVNAIRIRDSKFGKALVIESSESSGGYVLGFRIDPMTKLKEVHNQLLNLFNVHANTPSLGVESALEMEDYITSANSSSQSNLKGISDESEMLEESNEGNRRDALAAYMALECDTETRKDREIVFSPELGLAIEKLRDGFTLESLWNVVPNDDSK